MPRLTCLGLVAVALQSEKGAKHEFAQTGLSLKLLASIFPSSRNHLFTLCLSTQTASVSKGALPASKTWDVRTALDNLETPTQSFLTKTRTQRTQENRGQPFLLGEI